MRKNTRWYHTWQWALAAALSGALLATSPARASPVFPGAIQQAAHMPCAPGCLLCQRLAPRYPQRMDEAVGA